MAKKQPAQPVRFQLVYELLLRWGAALLGLYHLLLSLWRYPFGRTQAMMAAGRWGGVVLLAAAGVYWLITAVMYENTMYRIKDFCKRFFTKEQILLLLLLVWYVICTAYCDMTYSGKYFKANDWYIFETAVFVLALYPLSVYFGRDGATRIVKAFIHIITALSAAFVAWCLFNVFQLNVVQLPGGQVGMTSDTCLQIACHYNITAAYESVLFCLALAMTIHEKKIWVKCLYGAASIVHMTALMLTNSRTSFVSTAVAVAVMAGMLAWHMLSEKKLAVRIGAGLAAAAAAAALFTGIRELTFILFENITHFGQISAAAQEGSDAIRDVTATTTFNGRTMIWQNALMAMTYDVQHFLFGVTPAASADMLSTVRDIGWEPAHAHNQFLQVGVSLGVPGLVVYIAWHVFTAIRSAKVIVNRRMLWCFPAVLLMLVVYEMPECMVLFMNRVCGGVFFLLAGWVNHAAKYPETIPGTLEKSE